MGMDKVVTRYFRIGTFGFVLAKVLGDELLFGPVHVGGYFAWMTLAEGGSLQVLGHLIPYHCYMAQRHAFQGLAFRSGYGLSWASS